MNASITYWRKPLAADEVARGELPAQEKGENDAKLDHEVGGRDHEHHRRGEVGALLEQ